MNLNNTLVIWRNARWLLRLTRASLFILNLCLISCASEPNALQESPVLILGSGGRGSEGPYPNYYFEIFENGSVHYRGTVDVPVYGDHYARITPAQVQDLIIMYKEVEKFFNDYEREKGYKLKYYHGHYFMKLQTSTEASQLAAGGLVGRLLSQLNKITPIEYWICFPKPPYLPLGGEDCPTQGNYPTSINRK